MKDQSWLIFVVCLVICMTSTSCIHYHKVHKKPTIYDGIDYGRVELPESTMEPYYFAEYPHGTDLPPLEQWAGDKVARKYDNPTEFVTDNKTTALLIIRNDTILYERYFNGMRPDSITQIFSVTKPLTASLLSVAIERDLIPSVDVPVNDYLSIKRRKKKANDLMLRHLAQMRSGLNHSDYWRWLRIMRFYHAKDADRYIQKVRVSRDPGKKYRYKSIDTQILGRSLEKIFGAEDLLEEFVRLYWNNIGPEHRAYFSIDHPESGNLKYYGGLNTSARDLAKIGKIYMNGGQFEGKQIIDREWLDFVTDTTTFVGRWGYSMGWYFDEYDGAERDIFYGAGFGGQYLIINRTTNTIIVRFGEGKAGHDWYHILCELSTLY